MRLSGSDIWTEVVAVLSEPLPGRITDRFPIEKALRETLLARGIALDAGPILYPASQDWLDRHTPTG